ncbi:hypothetical protein JTB14_018681 [Gonioctena quinquepunctata]|nr:hypothetical protein JTB14_018681 [Gonioctena quinquepunctata]
MFGYCSFTKLAVGRTDCDNLREFSLHLKHKLHDARLPDVTKMEHFKKRLIHQHERPVLQCVNSSRTIEDGDDEEDDERSNSPNKMKEDKVQTKVAKKRAVCRGKFRHKNMELYKLGTSNPSSLCKTKDPYKVCTEKNLQISCQNIRANGKKQEEHLPKTTITEHIINSIEGNGRRDSLQRLTQFAHKNSNSDTSNKHTVDKSNMGRHILPAIVPQLSEIRRKIRDGADEAKMGEHEQFEEQQRRQSISRRRKTVIGNERSNELGSEGFIRENGQERHRDSTRKSEESLLQNTNSYNQQAQPLPPSEDTSRNRSQGRKPPSPIPTFTSIPQNPQVIASINISPYANNFNVQMFHTRGAHIDNNVLRNNNIHRKSASSRNVSTSNCTGLGNPVLSNHQFNATFDVSPEPTGIRNTNIRTRSQMDPMNLSVREQMCHASMENFGINKLSNRRNTVDSTPASDSSRWLLRTYSENGNQSSNHFPGINTDVDRLGNTQQPPPNSYREQLRSKTQEKVNQDFAIKTTIETVKASMALPFSLDRLFTLNKCYRELQSFLSKRNVSKKLKLGITTTINEMITYVTYKIFGERNSMNFRVYTEKIMEVELAPQKPIIHDFISLGISKSYDEVAINAYIKVIRGETGHHTMADSIINRNPALLSQRTSHQESNPYEMSDFQLRFRPILPNLEIAQRVGMMESNQRTQSKIYDRSERIHPGIFRQGQDAVPPFARSSIDIMAPPNVHQQNPGPLYHADNRCVPPKVNPNSQFFNTLRKSLQANFNNDKTINLTETEQETARRRNNKSQDVEELLQPNIIIGKEMFVAGTSEQTDRHFMRDGKSNGNVREISDSANKSGATNKDSITKTFIVKDNSIEITKGDKHSKAPSEPINETVLEKVQKPSKKKGEINIKKEAPEGSKSAKNGSENDLEIFKKYLLEEDKLVYKNVMKKVVYEKEAKSTSQVIVVADDEDIQIEKLLDKKESNAEKTNESIQKKMKGNTGRKVSPEEIPSGEEQFSNSSNITIKIKDLNHNYVSTTKKNTPRYSQIDNRRMSVPHIPIIEDISSDEEPTRPIQPYKSNCVSTKDASTILSSNIIPPRSTKTNDIRNKTSMYSRPAIPVESQKKSFKRKSMDNHFDLNIKPNTPDTRLSSSPTRFPPNFPRESAVYPQSFRSPQSNEALSPVMPTPVVARSPVSSNSVLTTMQGKPGPNWQTWISDERRREFFDFDHKRSSSRRQSVETISSVGSDYSPSAGPEQNMVKIKVDSKWYRIKRSLFDKIPQGKLCYIREKNSLLRYFDDSQMSQFLENVNVDSNLEILEKNELIPLPEEVNFSVDDYIDDPELYVQEVLKVEQFAPRDFYGFYKFVTGYQIIRNNHPISFQTFLIMHNTNRIKVLFDQYLNKLLGKSNSNPII